MTLFSLLILGVLECENQVPFIPFFDVVRSGIDIRCYVATNTPSALVLFTDVDPCRRAVDH